MGKRAKIVAEIERQLARLEDRPGLCLYLCPPHGSDPVAAWAAGGDPGRLASMAAGSP